MGPLAGFKIVEIAGIGPAPMCGMLLADLGATLVRVDRPGPTGLGLERPVSFQPLYRGRPALEVDLKSEEGREKVLQLIDTADAVFEGFRPGAMERLGLGPVECLARNPKLVYGRVTGWGQDGPASKSAGHDLNYVALTGALDAIGRAGGPPVPPLNVFGDYAGGALYLALGMLSALLEAERSGKGQVVDAAMIDGASSLMTTFHGLRAAGMHNAPRGQNTLDGGAPFYSLYQCADGKYMSVAPIEEKFWIQFLDLVGLETDNLPDRAQKENWPLIRAMIAERLLEEPQAHWAEIFDGTDACCAPVLSLQEAPEHPYNRARDAFVTIDGLTQPAPAPRFSRTNPDLPAAPQDPTADFDAIWAHWNAAGAPKS